MYTSTRTYLIHIFGSLAFLSIPVFTSPDFYSGTNLFTVKPFLNHFLRYVLLLLFFYVNYYFFIPRFYFSSKKIVYAAIILACLFLIIQIPDFFFPNSFWKMLPPDFPGNRMGMPKPPRFDFHLFEGGFIQFMLVLFLSFLLKINSRLNEIRDEKLNAEVSYLKAQINPHFLFNTLNSLYALTLQKSNEAPNAVLKLSGIMRYVVTESAQDYVSLDKELNYIKDYIELQKLRLDSSVPLVFEIDGSSTGRVIAPLILIPFIENAFKYGINPDEDSFIKIKILIAEQTLTMNVQNAVVAGDIPEEEKTEEGLKNTQKRLDLIYANNYVLDIKEDTKTYEVQLKIELL